MWLLSNSGSRSEARFLHDLGREWSSDSCSETTPELSELLPKKGLFTPREFFVLERVWFLGF